jgi:hypothetical protein
MFSNLNFFDYVIIISGALVCLKRVAEMQRYHELRVVILTAILSFIAIFFFLGHLFTQGSYICIPPIDLNDTSAEHFTCNEM